MFFLCVLGVLCVEYNRGLRNAHLRLPLPQVRPRVRSARAPAGSGSDGLPVLQEPGPRTAAIELRREHGGKNARRGEAVAAAPDQCEQGKARRRRGVPQGTRGTLMAGMHEIDYKVFGDDMQFVEVELDPDEATVAEAGGMMYMDDGIEMETIFGDGSPQQGGIMGALMGAGKRLLTGESLFMTVFLNRTSQKRKVAFGAPYPGKIVPIHLAEVGGELVAQKDSFLAAAKGVSIGIAFQRKLGVGLFGGEGF